LEKVSASIALRSRRSRPVPLKPHYQCNSSRSSNQKEVCSGQLDHGSPRDVGNRGTDAQEFLEALKALPPEVLDKTLDNFEELLDILWEWYQKDLEGEQVPDDQEEILELTPEETGCLLG